MNLIKLSALLIVLIFASRVNAVEVSEKTSFGTTLLEQSISGDGELGGDEDHDPEWNWNLDFTREHYNASDVIDDTNSFEGGAGWESPIDLDVDGSLAYSTTLQEDLTSRGGTLSASYRYEYAKDTKFSPSIRGKMSGSATAYAQNFSGTTAARRKGRAKPTSGSAEIRQISGSVAIIWRPLKRFRVALTYAYYGYDKDVAQFENSLDSPAGLEKGVSGFADAVGGLPDQSYEVRATYELTEILKIVLFENFSTLAFDKSPSQTQKGDLVIALGESWHATVGLEALRSSDLTDTLAVLGFAYEF